MLSIIVSYIYHSAPKLNFVSICFIQDDKDLISVCLILDCQALYQHCFKSMP